MSGLQDAVRKDLSNPSLSSGEAGQNSSQVSWLVGWKLAQLPSTAAFPSHMTVAWFAVEYPVTVAGPRRIRTGLPWD